MQSGRKIMMATASFHPGTGINVPDEEPAELCLIHSESPNYYIGSWVTGMGLLGNQFPKKSTRPLTDEEFKYWRYKRVSPGASVSPEYGRPLTQITKDYDDPTLVIK